ncbi:XRE family transcriptional regulator [Periweissella cryptocerci]|uniref:XRE family transcriptional regulator n=1 Tax=Periweissella cryptocerci TaxID=2506420 RepID=A0A4P6YQZ9_9LACO|nr:helix-turn-helix transcriptional regulator [Periweissella cryptocerci]QBO35031.1 XRE family transcriptional regulator [Periweissella cryptocerci]
MVNSVERKKELGDFLKVQRAKITPEQVGLPKGKNRRTPGLRREEVATLAGVGVTWYTWLEQGRDIQVSTQVLEAIAGVLQLNEVEVQHLFTLGQQAQPTVINDVPVAISPMLQHVIDNLEYSPATILDQRWNIVGWNNAAEQLWYDFSMLNIADRNVLRLMFLYPENQDSLAEWEKSAKQMVAHFRMIYGENVNDPWYEKFVQQLRTESPKFNELWQQHDIIATEEKMKLINHQTLGRLEFEETSFFVGNDSHLELKLFTAAPGSESLARIMEYLK